jgi:hypothetical protein
VLLRVRDEAGAEDRGGPSAGDSGGNTDRDVESREERDDGDTSIAGTPSRRNLYDTPSSGRPRLHRRPTVSITAAFLLFPLPLGLSCVATTSRRVVVNHV